MAKSYEKAATAAEKMIGDARRGVFASSYILMGSESYYVDAVCDAILENAIPEQEKDFCQSVLHGTDVASADDVMTAAKNYPFMGERQLILVRDAQNISNYASEDGFARYFADPSPFTILVLAFRGKSVDKRTKFYKSAVSAGVAILESEVIRDYEAADWISSYCRSKGLAIAPDAAALMAENCGTSLSKIALEIDKMLKNLPDGTRSISVSDVEKNISLTREFSIFELTKELSYRNTSRALYIAKGIASDPKFALPAATSALFTHFFRLARLYALRQKNPGMPLGEQAKEIGVNPFFLKEYESALRNYSLASVFSALSILKHYDYLGKGGDGAAATPSELMIELTVRLLSV